MELWIRNQNKMGLYQIENIYIDEDEDKTIHIWADAKTKYLKYYLGGYKTKERALEVLNEIQNILKPQLVLSKAGKPIAETCDGTVYASPDEYEIKELSCVVYEMPKE